MKHRLFLSLLCLFGMAACGIVEKVARRAEPITRRLPCGSTSLEPQVKSFPADETVKSVHLVAPTIVMIVLRGGDASGWDTSWAASKDGSDQKIVAVHRHSYPVGAPGYDIGFGARDDAASIDVEHRVFLELASAVGSRANLKLVHPKATATFDFDDSRSETPVVQLNQVGYHPRATKRWAYVSLWMGSGGGVDLSSFPSEVEVLAEACDGKGSTRSVMKLPLTERGRGDSDAGADVAEIDLASLVPDDASYYRLRIAGVGVSYRTKVSDDAVREAFRVTARGLFHNRWAGDLKKEHTDWPRPVDHGKAYKTDNENIFEEFDENTPKSNEFVLEGGYHDAGDFDQRPSHTVVPQLLMRAFELDPSAFADRALDIPESGNGVPDLLDEAMWGVRAWMALQEEDGGVRAGVESHRHPWGVYFAHDDPLPYFAYARNAAVTARAAGLFAQMSRLIAPYDKALSADLQTRSLRALQWAERHDASAVFLLYPLSELTRLTGDPSFAARFREKWRSIGPEGAFNAFANEHLDLGDYDGRGRAMPDYLLAYFGSPHADRSILELGRKWIAGEAEVIAKRTLESAHAHRSARRLDDFAWGMGVVMGRYMDPVIARLQLGSLSKPEAQRLFDTLSVAADYVLGANPAGMVYITGLGTVSPREPLHLDSLVWKKKGKAPVPGIPVYGPTSAPLPQHEWYKPGLSVFHPPFEDHPPMLRFGDVRTFVVTSEFTVWEVQAPHVEHFAVLLSRPELFVAGSQDGVTRR